MSVIRRAILVLLVLVSCAGCDRVSKSYAQSRLSETRAASFLAGSVRLQLSYNEGAFLSLGSSLPRPWRQAIFRTGVGGMLCVLLAYALFARARPRSIFGASLLFAGGVSNLVDRFVYDGYVVDFINIGIGSLRTGIFNFADVAIMAGILVMLTAEIGAPRKRT